MISDAQVEKALDWLRDHSEEAAKARAERIYMEEYRKSLKALIMKEHADLPLGAQEREAYDDPRYREHLESFRTAVHIDEFQRFRREAASAKIQAWQTMSANNRKLL